MTHPQLDPNFDTYDLITSITFRNVGYGYRTTEYVEDLSLLFTQWGIKHAVLAPYSEHGRTYPELIVHTHGDMELIKLRLEKRLIKVNVWRSPEEVIALQEAEMKASMLPQTVNVSYDWGKELVKLINNDPHLFYGKVNWLARKAMIFDSYEYKGDIGYLPLSGCHYYRLPNQGHNVVNKVSTMQLALDSLRTRTC